MFKMIDLERGVPVQYVGVYVLSWKSEWGAPTVGFCEVEEGEDALTDAETEIRRLRGALSRIAMQSTTTSVEHVKQLAKTALEASC